MAEVSEVQIGIPLPTETKNEALTTMDVGPIIEPLPAEKNVVDERSDNAQEPDSAEPARTPTKPVTRTSLSSSEMKLRDQEVITSDSPNNNEPPAKKIKKTPKRSPAKKKQAKRGKGRKSKDDVFNDVDAILGPDVSPLYADAISIQAILEHPKAKAILSATGDSLDDLSIEDIQRAAALFKEDGIMQHHDQQWLVEAQMASERRQAGDFDEYLQSQFVEYYGEGGEALSDSDEEAGESVNDAAAGSRREEEDSGRQEKSTIEEKTSGSPPAGPTEPSLEHVHSPAHVTIMNGDDPTVATSPKVPPRAPTPEDFPSVEDMGSPVSSLNSDAF